jgi:hypothetical protein
MLIYFCCNSVDIYVFFVSPQWQLVYGFPRCIRLANLPSRAFCQRITTWFPCAPSRSGRVLLIITYMCLEPSSVGHCIRYKETRQTEKRWEDIICEQTFDFLCITESSTGLRGMTGDCVTVIESVLTTIMGQVKHCTLSFIG